MHFSTSYPNISAFIVQNMTSEKAVPDKPLAKSYSFQSHQEQKHYSLMISRLQHTCFLKTIQFRFLEIKLFQPVS